ncbi:MAG: DNA internalization-related competence protein ComEC/Rec2 [Gammaproteobacteria bacterium]
MGKAAAAMLAGVLLLLGLPELPSGYLVAALCAPFGLLLLPRQRLAWALFLPLGFAWCWFIAGSHLAARLTPELEGQKIAATGWVHSIPEARGSLENFEFEIEALDGRAPAPGIPRLIRLSMDQGLAQPGAGEHWRLDVRLRRPRGFMDPGAFDYEGWLFRHDIGATGYATGGAMLDGASRFPLLRMRASLVERIQKRLGTDQFAGMAAALATGDQGAISETQWQVLQDTNTVHLMAIAGLHIGVLAGLFFLLAGSVWRRSAWLCSRCPAPIAAAVAALLAASMYSAMAGFPLPTQRALIMLAAFTLGVLLRRRLKAIDTLGLAMVGVLLLDPLSAAEASFWLSFSAVAAILFVFGNRLGAPKSWLVDLLRTQWAVGIGLLPLLAFFFQRAGLTAPIANLAEVPIYSLLVVPLVLMGAALLALWPWAGTLLLKGATLVMGLSWPLLERLADIQPALLTSSTPGWTALGVSLLGAAWLLMPRGLPARLAAVSLLLPLFVAPLSEIPAGSFDLTLLDVGQGLSAVVRTAGHTLVYDTGPKFQSGSDTGGEVVIPYLMSQGIAAPDLAVVSHGDRDHAGGLASLRAAFRDMPVISGAEYRFPDVITCIRGQHWEWDGVSFQVLYPDAGAPAGGNDASCVVRVSGQGGSALLTGDIMRKSERHLLELEGDALHSDTLVAPHHGSNSSSSEPFVAAVSPSVVLFPVGYRNRWGFPKPEVVARYLEEGATLADSATDGAVRVRFRPGVRPAVVMRRRPDMARLWTAH